MSRTIAVYMHTISGSPARFDGRQIVYLTDRTKRVLRYSLAAIKQDQELSAQWRRKQGFGVDESKYGYVMFYVEEPRP